MSNPTMDWWNRASGGHRLAMLAAVTLLLAAASWTAFTMLRTQYAVLFTDLAPADAAAIVERLKADKVPYRLPAGARSIEVPAEQVHEVRLQLMSANLPLSGGIGFEIFDKQGLGTTEHSQQVSYQRALQGELIRTIGALEHVESVRVHLVMPRTSLFARDREQASAAVTIAMEPGTALQPGQIAGVQRLVAAAVAGLAPGQVVITDQRGITLSAGDASSAGAADARLQVKRDVESYLIRKVAEMLDGAFGGGQAIVTVDAALNFDNTKTTVQDLLPAREAEGAGSIVRRRQVTGAGSAVETVWTGPTPEAKSPGPPGSSVEVEYQYGRRVAEVVTAPGALARLSIGVIVPGPLVEEKRQRIAELVRMAAGFDEGRGDAISVQALEELSVVTPQVAAAMIEPSTAGESGVPVAPHTIEPRAVAWFAAMPQERLVPIVALAVTLLSFVVLWRRARQRRLSVQARQLLLEDLERAMSDAPLPVSRVTP